MYVCIKSVWNEFYSILTQWHHFFMESTVFGKITTVIKPCLLIPQMQS